MMNPILQAMQMQRSNPSMMLKNYNQMKQVMDLINKNGGDPKTAFYNLAKQKGVDPNTILNMLK